MDFDLGNASRALVALLLIGPMAVALYRIGRRAASSAGGAVTERVEPMHPAARRFLAHRRRRSRRSFLLAIALMTGGLMAVGAIIYVAEQDPLGFGLAILGSAVLGTVLGLYGWYADRKLAADERGNELRLATGGVEAVGSGAYYRLYVGARSLSLEAAEASKIPRLAAGSVLYSPRAQVVIEVRDGSGDVVYRAPTYDPGAR